MKHAVTIRLLTTLCLVLAGPRVTGQEETRPVPATAILDALRSGLDDTDRGVRFAASQAMGKSADATVIPDTARMLLDDEWCVRMQAAHSLRAFGERSVPAFAAALDPNNPFGTRHAAAVALVRLGEIGEAPLRIALADEHERIRYVAARAFADESVVPALRILLAAKDTVIGIEAARILTELGYGADAIPTLLAGVRSHRGVLRTEVAGILSRTNACGPDEAKVLVETYLATKQNEHRLRTAIEKVLVKIGRPALEAIRAGLGAGPEDPWKSSLWYTIGKIIGTPPGEDRKAADPPEEPEEAEEDNPLVVLADPKASRDDRRFAALLLTESPEARPALLRLLEDPRAAEFALDALLAMDGGVPTTEKEARALLASPGPAARRLGIRALRALGVTEPVRPRLTDPDAEVRATARWTLAPAKPASRPAAPPLPPVAVLIERMADPDLAVSRFAADALPRHGGAAASPLARAMATAHYGILHYAEWIFMRLGPAGAGATAELTALVGHGDVNVREVAVRCLGEIGPGAAAAVPALVRALRAPRISVRARAAVALGRIGEAAASPLLAAAKESDARVRAGAVFALGWVLGERNGIAQVATDIRLPVAEPGPAAATGFVPTEEQFARAATLRSANNRKEAERLVADLGPEARVGVLRAGLRLEDVRAAVRCASLLEMQNLDAWEAERCVELLLPEVFRPPPPAGFYRVYEYLGSSEVAAAIHYLTLADPSDRERTGVLGACHRIVRWDLIPELCRVDATPDAWVLGDSSDVWMPRSWSERYRELWASALPPTEDTRAPEAGRLPHLLRRMLERGIGFPHFVNGWLNESVPGERDAPLLLDLAKRAREAGDNWQDLTTLIRALGHVNDRESERFLLSVFPETGQEGHFARSALARRGDPDALRRLREDAREDWLPLSLLMEVRPQIGAAEFRRQLIEGNGIAPCWVLSDDFVTVRWHGVRWPDGLFDGIEATVLEADPGPLRLAHTALMVPGCRTRRMAAAILAGLPGVGADPVKEPEHGEDEPPADPAWPDLDELFAFLHAADQEGTVALLRDWAKAADEDLRRRALRTLMSIGDPASAHRMLRYLRDESEELEGYESQEWNLARSATPDVEAFLKAVLADPDATAEQRETALRELAILKGLPGPAAWPATLTEASDTEREALTARILAGRPVEGLLAWFRGAGAERIHVEVLGALAGSADADGFLRELSNRRASFSYPKVLGQLAIRGDVAARRELWSGYRAGRYRWICYENEEVAMTMGWDSRTYPALLSETESNCCRGGHVARMFEEFMGDDALDYQPRGQDGTPMRNAREWLRLYGGTWIRSPVGQDPFGPGMWIPAAR